MVEADLLVAIGTIILAVVTFITAIGTLLTVREMQQQQKRHKLTEEMSLLVGPLFSKKDHEILLGITTSPPNRSTIDDSLYWRHYYDFWDSITANIYLAPHYLREGLIEYLAAKDAYWNAFEDGNHGMIGSFEKTPMGQKKRKTFDLKKEALNNAVKACHISLIHEIDQNEKVFWSPLLRR